MPRHNGNTARKPAKNRLALRRLRRRKEAAKGRTPHSKARLTHLLPEEVYDLVVEASSTPSESNEDAA